MRKTSKIKLSASIILLNILSLKLIMFPRINPKQMNKLMKQLGMKVNELEAEEVIIKLADKEIVIKNPSVSKIELQGQSSYQISGSEEVRERIAESESEKTESESKIREEDIKFVAEHARVSFERAKKALEETNGDIAEAIVKLSQK